MIANTNTSVAPVAGQLAKTDLRILLVEDSLECARRVQGCLGEGLSGGFLIDRTETLVESLSHLERFDYDVALVDPSLPDSNGLSTLNSILRTAPDLPVVILIGFDDEQLALMCIEAGAQDYVIKGDFGIERLVRSLHSAMQRKQTQGERRRSEDRLQRSRQIEATGRLAGGVAHDFNNILTSIMGYTELCLGDVEPGGPLHQNLLEIQEASRLAALLTRRLLAFGRRQLLRPSLLDINEFVLEFEGLLESSVGESVELQLALDPDRPFVNADRSQLEAVLMDLALNARDAMPEGGRLTLITANVELDSIFARKHEGAGVGPHVMLSVGDTGCGMDRETLQRIFEPFFSTKQQDNRGLGLAAVYGIVKQSGGTVHVESEPGVGSTFDIYLPKAADTDVSTSDQRTGKVPSSEVERILLVEDDRRLRAMAEKSLSGKGYEVLTAGDATEALTAAEDSGRPFDLLITDLVMPGMGGLELAKRLAERDPELRVLLMSGYPHDDQLDEDAFAAKAAFIGKPFKPSDLVEKVRIVLAVDL